MNLKLTSRNLICPLMDKPCCMDQCAFAVTVKSIKNREYGNIKCAVSEIAAAINSIADGRMISTPSVGKYTEGDEE